jgi:hypothetical protein
MINLGVCADAESSKGHYLTWFVVGLALGIVLLRYGARLLAWILPDTCPATRQSLHSAS